VRIWRRTITWNAMRILCIMRMCWIWRRRCIVRSVAVRGHRRVAIRIRIRIRRGLIVIHGVGMRLLRWISWLRFVGRRRHRRMLRRSVAPIRVGSRLLRRIVVIHWRRVHRLRMMTNVRVMRRLLRRTTIRWRITPRQWWRMCRRR